MPITPRKNSRDQYQIYIAGQWRDSEAAELHANRNPAHKSQILGHVAETTGAEVAEAMAAADAAFPKWRAISGNVKTKLFLHLAQSLYAHYDEIVRTMTREMGKTHFDSRLDLDEAIGVVECVAPQGLSLKGENVPEKHRRRGHGKPTGAAWCRRDHYAV